MKPLPEHLRDQAARIAQKHAKRGWRHIDIGVPGPSSLNIVLRAVAANGQPFCLVARLDESGLEEIDRELSSH